MWQFWIILSGISFIIEIATAGFLVFWFGVGALISMIISLFTSNVLIQATVFVVSSTLLLFCTKPFVNKFSKTDNQTKTNAYSIIGKKGIVLQDIEPINGTGQIKVGTEVWSAKSNDNRKIEKGIEIEILAIEGVKAIVK